MRSRYSRACPVSSSITAPAKNFWYTHSFSWRFVLAQPSTFVIFLLLIVKSGIDAVSFAANHAMQQSCLSCTDILLLLLTWLLEDVSGSMTVLNVFDIWTLLGGGFLLFLLEVPFWVTLLQLVRPLEPFLAVVWLRYLIVVFFPGFCWRELS